MDRHPAAYIRRSFVDADSPGDISREAQRAAVRRLATADGHNGDLVEYDDWGVSADIAKSGKRTAYTRLLADMEAGSLSAVYAFDVDRLYRDPRDLIRLQDAASRHAVTITTTGGRLAIGEGDDPAAEAFAFIGAVFGRMELQKSKRRARAALAARRERGDRLGHPPYGYLHVRDDSGRVVQVPDPERPASVVVDAYREAGSVLGACRILEARGVPAPKGGARWSTSNVTRIIEREAPGLLPPRTSAGRRSPTKRAAVFTQLLPCPFCRRRMTPNVARGQYYCPNGPRDRAAHPRYAVTEAAILPWVRAEVDAHLALPPDLPTDEDNEATRADLAGRLDRANDLYIAGTITRERYDAERAAVDAELDRLGAAEAYQDVPAFDWSWSPARLNQLLRMLLVEIRLDAAMRPVDALWRLERFRS